MDYIDISKYQYRRSNIVYNDMSKCKGINATGPKTGKRCQSVLIFDKYKNGYCHAHQKQAPQKQAPQKQVIKIIHQMDDSDSDSDSDPDSVSEDSLSSKDQEKVLIELTAWMPNEKERVLTATQLVLDQCKRLNKEKEAMSQCIEQINKEKEAMSQCIDQQSDRMLYMIKASTDAKANDIDEYQSLERFNDELTEENERLTEENERLTEENERLKKQKPPQVTKKPIDPTDEIASLKRQLANSKKWIDRMLPDYTIYQEVRRFEDTTSQLMALYMAEERHELYDMMREKPEAAIPLLGRNPAAEYNALRKKRNKHCHP
jgi:hypothetical protein